MVFTENRCLLAFMGLQESGKIFELLGRQTLRGTQADRCLYRDNSVLLAILASPPPLGEAWGHFQSLAAVP